MKRILFTTVLAAGLVMHVSAAEWRSFLPDAATGSAGAVLVEGPAALVHTTQCYPEALNAGIVGQTESVLLQIDRALHEGGGRLANVARLNVYVTQPELVPDIQKVLARTFAGDFKPAVTWVTTELILEDALVAADAVGLKVEASSDSKTSVMQRTLPEGPRVYISGQAEKGDGSMRDATRKTLESLQATLEFLGLTLQDVIQAKAFLTPLSAQAEAEAEMKAFFGKHPPVRSYVEWESTLPIEIELVVSAAKQPLLAQGDTVEFRTPDGMKASPVFSRLAIVRHPDSFFTGSLFASDTKGTAEVQVRTLFGQLKKLLDASGSDWGHLVKATYYVSKDDVSTAHNQQRAEYFNPQRPPAASKAKVKGVGLPGHGINLDMIAVPTE